MIPNFHLNFKIIPQIQHTVPEKSPKSRVRTSKTRFFPPFWRTASVELHSRTRFSTAPQTIGAWWLLSNVVDWVFSGVDISSRRAGIGISFSALRIWRKKGFFKAKGRVVNQENYNESRDFSTALPVHFFGLPLGLSVDCSFSSSAVRCFQRSSPNGVPRFMLFSSRSPVSRACLLHRVVSARFRASPAP